MPEGAKHNDANNGGGLMASGVKYAFRAPLAATVAALIGGTTLSAGAGAMTLTYTQSGSVHYDIRLSADASAIGPSGFPAQTDADGAFQGTTLTFPGFNNSLGTLTNAIWTLNGTYVVDVYVGSVCIQFLGFFCSTNAQTSTQFEAAVNIGDSADPLGPPGIPDPGGGPPLPASLPGEVHREGPLSTSVSGSGIIGCLVGATCSTRRVTSLPFVNLMFDRSDPELLAAYLAGPVNLGLGAVGLASLSVQCGISIGLLTQCSGTGRSTATLSTTATLTYVYTPFEPSPQASVPVPSTELLFVSGLVGLVAFRRRQSPKA